MYICKYSSDAYACLYRQIDSFIGTLAQVLLYNSKAVGAKAPIIRITLGTR